MQLLDQVKHSTTEQPSREDPESLPMSPPPKKKRMLD